MLVPFPHCSWNHWRHLQHCIQSSTGGSMNFSAQYIQEYVVGAFLPFILEVSEVFFTFFRGCFFLFAMSFTSRALLNGDAVKISDVPALLLRIFGGAFGEGNISSILITSCQFEGPGMASSITSKWCGPKRWFSHIRQYYICGLPEVPELFCSMVVHVVGLIWSQSCPWIREAGRINQCEVESLTCYKLTLHVRVAYVDKWKIVWFSIYVDKWKVKDLKEYQGNTCN